MTADTLIERAAKVIGAFPSDIPGLWNAPGYPELTTAQLISVARGHDRILRAQTGEKS